MNASRVRVTNRPPTNGPSTNIGMPQPMGIPVVPPVVPPGEPTPRPPFTPVMPSRDGRGPPVIPDISRFQDEPQRRRSPYVSQPPWSYLPSVYVPSPSPPVAIIPLQPYGPPPPPITRITHPTHSPTESSHTQQSFDAPPMVVQESRRRSTPTHHTVVVPGASRPSAVPVADAPRPPTRAESIHQLP